MVDPVINPDVHIQSILEAINELMTLHPRTAAPAPLPHQYVGTIIDNTVGLLTAPANSLDGGSRSLRFESARNWLSLIQAVHRSFISSLHTATEVALVEFCRQNDLHVAGALGLAAEKAFADLATHMPDNSGARKSVKNLRNLIRTVHPGFTDYLEAVLKSSPLSTETRSHWRKFFRALSIARNKASHGNPALSKAEINDMRKGGLGFMVDANETLVTNPRMYFALAELVLGFLDIICRARADA
jgi:hypothetical protein